MVGATEFQAKNMVELKSTALASEGTFLIDRANLIFCLCPVCLNEVNWRHLDATYELTGECCCHAFRAYPANSKCVIYRIDCKPVNMQNVQWLHRRSADTYMTTPPPKRYS